MIIPSRNNIIASELYQKANSTKKEFRQKEDLLPIADWLLEYVKDKYKHYSADLTILEQKADGIIKYLGIILTALIAIVGWTKDSITEFFFWGLIVGGAFIFIGILFALSTKFPIPHSSSPSLDVIAPKFLKHKSSPKLNLDLAFIMNESISGTREIIKWKSRQLKISFILFTVGILLLFVGGIPQLELLRGKDDMRQSPLSSQSTSSSSSGSGSGSGRFIVPESDSSSADSGE